MSAKRASIYIIIVSLIAAAAILLSSNLFNGSQTVTYLIIAVWFVPFSWLAAQAAKERTKADHE